MIVSNNNFSQKLLVLIKQVNSQREIKQNIWKIRPQNIKLQSQVIGSQVSRITVADHLEQTVNDENNNTFNRGFLH